MPRELSESELARTLDQARHGLVSNAETVLASLERNANPADEVWQATFRGVLWELGVVSELPSPASVAAYVELAHHASAELLVTCATAALTNADLALLGECVKLARVDGEQRWKLAQAYLLHVAALMTGDTNPAASSSSIDELERHVADTGWADLTVRVASLKAMAQLHRGDRETGLREARRASRMAQVEELPAAQYLAHLALARARRASGRSHHAVRVLRSVAVVAPSPWRSWLTFETLMAGGSAAVAALTPERNAGTSLSPLLAATRWAATFLSMDGSIPSDSAPPLPQPFATELYDLRYAVGAGPSDRVSEPMRAWVEGKTPDAPHGLLGLSAIALGELADDASSRTAAVIMGTDLPIRRWLRCALVAIAPPRGAGGRPCDEGTRTHRARVGHSGPRRRFDGGARPLSARSTVLSSLKSSTVASSMYSCTESGHGWISLHRLPAPEARSDWTLRGRW